MAIASVAERSTDTKNHSDLEHELTAIVERIRERNRRSRQIAEVLRKLKAQIDLAQVNEPEQKELMESSFFEVIIPANLENISIMGVDGGMLSRALHGLDLILVRAIATIFHYRSSELSTVEYYPSELPPSRLMSITEALDAHEFEMAVGIQRQLAEVGIAGEALEEHPTDLLLLDGSIVPQYVDRLPYNPEVRNGYHKLIDAFCALYSRCAEAGTLLAGVVKDSRSSRFVDMFQNKILPNLAGSSEIPKDEFSVLADNGNALHSRDTAFLNRMLEVGERSFVFRYAGVPASQVLRDLGDWYSRVHVFYLKTVPYDRPLRIEFVRGEEVIPIANRIASLIFALSAHHDAYGIPSVLMEADARARLPEEELDVVCDSIADRIGPSNSVYLRRHVRPFW